MTDDEIAESLVEAKILTPTSWGEYGVPGENDWHVPACEAVTDWRTAGTCLELWPGDIQEFPKSFLWILREPRAICEQFANAVSAGQKQ